MSTLKELTYRLWRRLDGGNISDDSKYTYRELVGHIKAGIADGLLASYNFQRNSEDFKYGDDSITASYKATVKYDTDKSLNYVELKAKTISVAGNRFTQISDANQVNRFSTIYVPIRREEILLRRLQPQIPCVVMFYREDGKLYFYNQEVKTKEVLISDRYSIPTDDNSDLTLPAEFENKLIQNAFILLTNPMVQPDRANDGIPLL